MLILDTDLLRLYGWIINGDEENAAEFLSDAIDRITLPLDAKDGQEACGAAYDPWDEGEPLSHHCTLRKGHDARIHAHYEHGSCHMWWLAKDGAFAGDFKRERALGI